MTLLEAARQALPGIAWEEQTAHNGATWALGVGIRGHYSVFDVGDIAELAAELKAERDALDDDLGEPSRAAMAADLTALRERMRWRDVREGLPDEYEDVIVEHVEGVGEAYMVRELDGSPLWYRNDYRLKSVARWTYMPAAPEVQAVVQKCGQCHGTGWINAEGDSCDKDDPQSCGCPECACLCGGWLDDGGEHGNCMEVHNV